MKTTIPLPQLTSEVIARFWSKVTHTVMCWNWTGYHRNAYGAMKINGRLYSVHRIAFALQYGYDPGQQQVCHTCDNPECVRWDHLFVGTDIDNVADRVAKGRSAILAGTDNGMAQLTPNIVQLIRASKLTEVAMGHQFNISASLAGQIRRRQRWKHLP